MKMKVVKRNGKRETFRKGKIMRSLQGAGVESHIAKIIVHSIKARNGMTTKEIREYIGEYLEHVNMKTAERYRGTTRMHVHNDIVEVEGNCLLKDETMARMGLSVGQEIDIYNGEQYEKLRVYGIHGDWIKPDHLYLSHEDMSEIGIHNESKIAFKKHEELT